MMFDIIMHMPVRAKKLEDQQWVHRLICSYKVESMAELIDDLNQTDFILVDEWYPNELNQMQNHGSIALNRRYVGKIKEWSK
jgi:hypothetical protein